jgi:hypothetical protein
MAVGSLAPVARQQFLDANANPLAGGKLFTFLAGTSTPSPIYTDAALAVPHPNPAILDAGGFLTIYMAAVNQKWILQNAAGVTQWTVDPIASVVFSSGGGDLFEVFTFEGLSTQAITNTTYPAGALLDKTHAGTSVLLMDPNLMPPGTYQIRAVCRQAAGIPVVSVGIFDLSVAPDTPLAEIVGTPLTTNSTFISPAIVWPPGGSVRTFGIKVKVSTGTANVWGVQLLRS